MHGIHSCIDAYWSTLTKFNLDVTLCLSTQKEIWKMIITSGLMDANTCKKNNECINVSFNLELNELLKCVKCNALKNN